MGEAQALAGYAPSGNRRAYGAGVQDRQHCLRAGAVPGPIRAVLAFSRAVIPDANLQEGRQAMQEMVDYVYTAFVGDVAKHRLGEVAVRIEQGEALERRRELARHRRFRENAA